MTHYNLKKQTTEPIKSILSPFAGTVDDLLNHVSKFDANEVESLTDGTLDVPLTDVEAIEVIKSEMKVDDEDAKKLLTEMKEEVVTECISKLIADGHVEVHSYDVEGQPLYSLTESGKAFADKIKPKKDL